MKVKLINHTPEPEKTIAASARLCYSPIGAVDIWEDFTDEKIEKLLKKILQMGHMSPFEHASFTFAVEGISRNCSHQLVRHRMASYSQKSQRYVEESQFDYIIPPSIRNKPEALMEFENKMREIQASYNALLAFIPKEDARYVLPGACETKLVFTMNARSLYNFFEHRACMRAQWEIRALANAMMQELVKVAPLLFSKAGATCDTIGVCYEGKMSCGKCENVMER
ncbi:MAG: FAD-dependent thymidylate synthase [Clostridia bacterium]